MPLYGKVDGSSEFIPPGEHKARYISVVDLGTHKIKEYGIWLHKMMLELEMPEVKKPDGECFTVEIVCTLSMHPKSRLRRHIEILRSKVFTDQEAEEFDIIKLLGVSAIINVSINNGDTNISSIMPLKGSECPERVNDLTAFSLSDFDEKAFESLSKWPQNKIKESIEYKCIISEAADESVSDPDIGIEEADYLPF
jgi:hypothetical protein